MRADVIGLITENAEKHGVHDTVTETAREVYCEIRSVTRSEFYNALNAGAQPEVIFKLALAEDYGRERLISWREKKYRVIRTYETADGGIEITCERSDERGEE